MAEMTTKILTVELQADKAINGIVSLNDAIGKNTQQIKDNNAMIAENSKAMKQEGADVMALTAQNQRLAQSNVELEAKTKVLKDERRSLQKEIQNEVRANVQAEGSLKALRAELSNLTKQYDSLSKSERQNEQVGGALLKQINSVTTEIKQAEEETQRYFRNVGNYPEVAESVKGALRSMQDEIINLTMEYRTMSDEMKNSEAGQAMKQRIEELTQKASEYKDAMSDVKQSIREGASDTRGLDTAIQAGQTLAATFGLAQNAAQALGLSTDGLQKAMLKMQQAMQAVQALQVIQNALQKQSNLMRGVAIIQSKAAAAAEAIEARVKTQATGATIAQTVAQKAFNAVANANPYVLLATSILTVIGLIVGYTAATKDATEATSDETDSIDKQSKVVRNNSGAIDQNLTLKERVKQSEKEWSDAVSQNADNQISEYTKLQLKWLEVNKNQKDREKFQREYGDEVNRVAGRILKLSEYENFFVRDTDKVVAAILARAEAEAGAKKYAEATLKRAENNRNGTVANGRYYYNVSRDLNKGGNSASGEEMQAYERATGQSAVKGAGQSASGYKLTPEAQKWISDRRKETANAIKAADDAEIEYWKQFTTNAQKQAAAAEKAANMGGGKYNAPKAFGGGGSKGGGSKGGSSKSSNAQKTAKDTSQTLDQLADHLVDVQNDAYQRMAKADEQFTQKWIEDSKKAIETKAKDEIDATEASRKKDIENLKKSLEAKKITQGQYNRLLLDTQDVYDNKIVAIEQQKLNDIKKIDDEVAKHQKDAAEKARKDAEDALKKAKEDAEKQVQTMLSSMPEGTQGYMDWRLRQLAMQMQEELAMWENNEQMKVAIQKKYEQESEQVANEYLQHQMELQQQKYEAFGKIAGGLSQLFGEFADESKEAAILQKTLATAEVMLAQAVAIANAIKSAAMGSISPWQLVANIATSVTAVTLAMVQAFKALDSAKFATGGYIRGAGTGTSDSIPVRVSNGESIMNANTTAMFSGLLSSLNQLGGGAPIQATQSAQSIQGEDMLARAFAKGVAMLPNPVVSVVDINNGQRQVEVMNERATL